MKVQHDMHQKSYVLQIVIKILYLTNAWCNNMIQTCFEIKSNSL